MKGGRQNAQIEQPMKDEIKIRLPMVLDGTFFLQFTLFEVTSDSKIETSPDGRCRMASYEAELGRTVPMSAIKR